MTNSKNSSLEDVSKGNDESAPRANDSTSDKKTRFTKSKSISEVFKELEFEEDAADSASLDNFEEDAADSASLDNFEEDAADSASLDNFEEDASFDDFDEESLDDKYSKYDFDDDDEIDEIIPIHNEYMDLDKSDALADESIEGAVIINPDLDDFSEADVNESTEEYDVDSIENTDSIDEEADSQEFSESIDSVEDIDDEDFIAESDDVLADENVEEKIGKSSAQGVLINNKDKTSDSDRSLDIFNSSTIISIVGFIVGLAVLLIGITYYGSSSDRVVDNVLSGETAGLAIFLVIIGLIIIGFSILKFLSSSKSSLIIDTFNSIKSIDYDEVSEDVISREDFDAIFGIFKRKKDSNFSDNDKSVDSTKDLFENDDEVSDEDISSLYSESNLTSQKNRSSSKEHENASSTEISEDIDDGVDEIIPIHSSLNEQSDDDSFEEDDDGFDLVEEDSEAIVDAQDIPEEDDSEAIVDAQDIPADAEFDSPEDEIAEDFDELEVEKMDGLEDKYAKYDFDDDSDEETAELTDSKPKFKKSVDISKFEKEPLSEEELAEEKRLAQERLEEKKRRIIEGTNFDNSLRKQ